MRSIGSALSLKEFMHRQRVLRNYRAMLKAAARIEDKSIRNEIKSRIIAEHRANASIKVPETIKFLMKESRFQLETLQHMTTQRSIGESEKSWLDSRNNADDNDIRGRVGQEWPWER